MAPNNLFVLCFSFRTGPTPAAVLRPLIAMVARRGGVSAQRVSAAAALAATASRQLLRELQAAAAHVRPGDPCCTRHTEEDPRAERERGYTHTHTYICALTQCFVKLNTEQIACSCKISSCNCSVTQAVVTIIGIQLCAMDSQQVFISIKLTPEAFSLVKSET